MQSGHPPIENKLMPEEALKTLRAMPDVKALDTSFDLLNEKIKKTTMENPNPHYPKLITKMDEILSSLQALHKSKQMAIGTLSKEKLTSDNTILLIGDFEKTAKNSLKKLQEALTVVKASIKELGKVNENDPIKIQLEEVERYLNFEIQKFDGDFLKPISLLADDRIKARAALATLEPMPKVDEFKEKVKNIWKDLAKNSDLHGKSKELLLELEKEHYPELKKEMKILSGRLKAMEGSLATTKGLLTHQALDSKEIALSLDSFEDTVKDTLRQLVRVSRTIEDLLKKVSKEAERPAAYPAQEMVRQLRELEGTIAEMTQKINLAYHYPVSLLINPSFKEQHERVLRINNQLTALQKNLDLLENKLTELKMDSSGIRRLKEDFTKFLLLGTIHKEDYLKVESSIREMIDAVNEKGAPHTTAICRNIDSGLKGLQSDLLEWRKSCTQYYLSLAVKFGMSMSTGAFSVIIPTVPIVGAAMGSAFTPHLASSLTSHAISSVGGKAPTTVGGLASDKLSSTLSSPSQHRTSAGKPELHIPGKPEIGIKTKEDAKSKGLELELKNYSWNELFIMQSLQAIISQNRKELGVAALSAIAGGVLALTGVATPLILGMLAGASFTGSISLAGLKERGHVLKEQEIMTGIHKELKFIADRYELLKLGPYHGMDDYRKNTLQFVEAELKKLAPSGLRGTLEYMGFASSQNKEKIEMLLELKKMLEPTGVLGKEIDGFKYFADNSPVMDIKQSVDKAKYEVAKIEGTLIAMGIESPHAKQIKAAEKELKDSSTAIEKSYSSMDKKDDKVSSSKFFSSKDLPQKGQALLAAQFKVDSLKQIYNPDKFYTPTQGITR